MANTYEAADCAFVFDVATYGGGPISWDDTVDGPSSPGDIIGVETGTYTQLSIKNINVSIANKVIFVNLDGQCVFNTVASDNPLRNNTGLEVKGDNNSDTDYGFHFRRRPFIWAGAAEGNIGIDLHHCEVDDPQGSFIGISAIPQNADVQWTDIRIHHNYIHDADSEAIYIGESNGLYPLQDVEIDHNIVERSGEIQFGAIESGCSVHHNIATDGVIGVAANIEGAYILNPVTGSVGAAEFYSNIAIDCEGWGIYISSGTLAANVYNNLFINCGTGSQPTKDDSIQIASNGDVIVYNNTIATSVGYGIYASNFAFNTEIYNNIILDCTLGDIRQGGVPGANIHDNHTQDAGYTLDNYNFVDYANDDYHLTSSSPGVDAGTNTGAPADDLDGVLRDGFCDIGCYEFVADEETIPPAPSPPGTGAASVPCFVVADYQVRLKDQSGTVVAIFDDWRLLQFKRQINSPGFFTFIINGNDTRAGLFEADTQVEIWRSLPGELDWYIEAEGVVENIDYTLFSNGNFQFTAVGSMYIGLLKRRIVGYKETEDGALKTDFSETVMKEYAEENIGPSATVALGRIADGVMAGMSVAVSSGSGLPWTGDRSGKNLLNVLQEIANFSAIDFDVIGTGAATYEFQTFVDQLGEDRTTTGLDSTTGLNDAGNAPVIFDPLFGNVETMRYALRRRDEINSVFVFGQGQAIGRDVAVRTNTTEINETPINRREGMRGGGSQSTDDDLNNMGDEQLESLQRREVFDFVPLDAESTLYGVHYNFGDSVTARLGTIERNKRITGITFTVAEGGEQKAIEFTDIP